MFSFSVGVRRLVDGVGSLVGRSRGFGFISYLLR